MAEASVVEQRMRSLYSAVTAVLRPHGFQRSGTRWLKDLGDVVWLVQLERGSWNSRDDVVVRPYFAVVVPSVRQLIGGEADKPLHYVSGAVRGSLAEVGPRRLRVMMKRSVAYDVKAGDPPAAAEQIASRLREQLEQDVLPFLDRLRSPADVLAYLEQPKRPTKDPVGAWHTLYVCALHAVLGHVDEARAGLARLEADIGAAAARDPWAAHIAAVRSRLD